MRLAQTDGKPGSDLIVSFVVRSWYTTNGRFNGRAVSKVASRVRACVGAAACHARTRTEYMWTDVRNYNWGSSMVPLP